MSSQFYILCSLCFFLPSSYAIQYSHFNSFGGGNCTVRWKFDNETDTFHFKVVAKATGWVGFGFSRLSWPSANVENLQWNRKSMDHYDVIVGGVSANGSKYHKDYMTNGHVHPKEDIQQDWEVKNISESAGMTTMEFSRKIDTGDQEGDNVIEPGGRRIVCAYHETLDKGVNLTKHTKDYHQEIDFLEQPKESPVVEYFSDPPTTGASAIAASIIGNFLLFIIAVIFFY